MLEALSAWPVAAALRGSAVAYPLVNAAHIASVGLLLGAVVTLDLRLLGAFRSHPLAHLAPPLGRVAAAGLLGALAANRRGREGWAFVGTATAIGLLFVTAFVVLFPAVMPSSLDPAWSLTTSNAASTPYTLTIMTWAAAFATPVVLAYQAWTYWVFRRRLSVTHIPDDALHPAPAAR